MQGGFQALAWLSVLLALPHFPINHILVFDTVYLFSLLNQWQAYFNIQCKCKKAGKRKEAHYGKGTERSSPRPQMLVVLSKAKCPASDLAIYSVCRIDTRLYG